MSAPVLPFLAGDLVWAEIPIICWLVVGIVVMLIAVARFGWGGARNVLSSYRAWWGGSLAAAVGLAVVLGLTSGQPLPSYL